MSTTESPVTLKPTSRDGQHILVIDWSIAAGRLPYEPTPPLPDVYGRLSPIERATVRIVAPPLTEFPLRHSLLAHAAARLISLHEKGLIGCASGQQIARHLQSLFANDHPRAMKYAKAGWGILAAVDAANLGVEVWINAEPSADDLQHHRRMRLHERVRELDQTRPLRWLKMA